MSGGIAPGDLAEAAAALAEATGVSLAGGLDRVLVDGIVAAAAALGAEPGALARRIAARERDAVAALADHAVVSETTFWRHPEQLAAVARLAARAPGPLAIWSAGCATGEEAYSLAVALLEAGRLNRGDRIVATDVSSRALAAARAGFYAPRALRKLPPALLERWFEPGPLRRVGAAPRTLVWFARHNLLVDPPPAGAPFDVVLCRNVLIYFAPATGRAVLERLASALRPGGALVLGPVERPLAVGLGLEPVDDGGATLLLRPR